METLSDKELSEQLQGYGENVGPITATTRSVYERKLAKLMATEGETTFNISIVVYLHKFRVCTHLDRVWGIISLLFFFIARAFDILQVLAL